MSMVSPINGFSFDTVNKIENKEEKVDVRYDKPLSSAFRTITKGVPIKSVE